MKRKIQIPKTLGDYKIRKKNNKNLKIGPYTGRQKVGERNTIIININGKGAAVQ